MDLYDRIEELLHNCNMTKKDLCDKTGISYNTLSSLYRRRSKNVDLDTLTKIANCLNTSLDFLIDGNISYSQEQKQALQDMYFHLGKEAQEMGISQNDINLMLQFFKQHKENNKNQ